MADQTNTGDELSSEEAQAVEQLPPDHPVLRTMQALKAENKALKQRVDSVEQESETFIGLKSRFPFLERSDLEGKSVEKWDEFASRLNELRGANTGAEQVQPESEKPPVEHPEEKELARAQQLSGGTPSPTSPEQISAKEADDRYRRGVWSLSEYEDWMQQTYQPVS